ncbi:hypothetical protein ROHU_027720 [Labeo rohita]|uniref:Uncharacterized protein n=1 Tax=Labeo rohita TaxID=84645 RepID=A0A498M9N3_LABRO|nr:hypothetical protein ROHU_012244 [Labeo rohita]RXN16112.1 hypothetical protein ROHU_027720 [Labeo rohita]
MCMMDGGRRPAGFNAIFQTINLFAQCCGLCTEQLQAGGWELTPFPLLTQDMEAYSTSSASSGPKNGDGKKMRHSLMG